MISEKEAQRLIFENLPKPMIETINLLDSSGQVLAEDVISPNSSPTYTNSAMDGFAIKWKDLVVRKQSLRIGGESQAGAPFDSVVNPMHAVRISTGAMVPHGADTVIPIEDCVVDGDFVQILSARKMGQYMRYKGEEFQKGNILLEKGTMIQAQQIGLLASVGIVKIPAYIAPNVSIIVTGKELVSFDQSPKLHQLRDSISPMLFTALKDAGIANVFSQKIGDSLSDTIAALEKSVQRSKVIVISAGVSVGPHDHVKDAAKAAGFTKIFWKIRQKPGKPFYFACKKGCLLFGLPGNPVSAFMGFFHYVLPTLRILQGKPKETAKIKGTILQKIHNKFDLIQFFRIKISKTDKKLPSIVIPKNQGSHMLTSIANADGYICIKPEEVIQAGEQVEVCLF